jgi:hypothetical protein
MSKTAVILVSSQGQGASLFLSVGKMLKTKVYPHSLIVKTVVTPGEIVDSVDLINVDRDAEFSWRSTSNVDRVVTVSHSWSGDGQNLALGEGGYQPWGGGSGDGSLSSEGKMFWGEVGDAMRPGGKIILLGCMMGAGQYAANVARTANQCTYAAKDVFGAGHPDTVLKHVQAIEAGKVIPPMVKFNPL